MAELEVVRLPVHSQTALGGVWKDQSVGCCRLPVIAPVEFREGVRIQAEAIQERLPLVFMSGDGPRFVRRVVKKGEEFAFPEAHRLFGAPNSRTEQTALKWR